MRKQNLKPLDKENSTMEETYKAHIAGYIDGAGSILISISKDDTYSTGYQLRPIVRVNTGKESPMMGKLMDYSETVGANYTLTETDTHVRFVAKNAESIKQFLEPISEYLVQKYFHADVMTGVVVPAYLNQDHLTEEGFYELVEIADRLREGQPELRESKYTREYFDEHGISE
jgi:hypothetical protein